MRQRKPAEDRKAEIVKAALTLAHEVGPERVTTRMIATRLGLTQPAIYKHFASKDEIWSAVSEGLSARVADNIATQATAEGAPAALLRGLVEAHLTMMSENPALPEIMLMRAPNDGQIAMRSRIHARMGEFRQAIVGLAQAAQEAGQLHAGIAPKDAAALVFGVLQSHAVRILMGRDMSNVTVDGRRMLDLQLGLLMDEGE